MDCKEFAIEMANRLGIKSFLYKGLKETKEIINKETK